MSQERNIPPLKNDLSNLGNDYIETVCSLKDAVNILEKSCLIYLQRQFEKFKSDLHVSQIKKPADVYIVLAQASPLLAENYKIETLRAINKFREGYALYQCFINAEKPIDKLTSAHEFVNNLITDGKKHAMQHGDTGVNLMNGILVGYQKWLKPKFPSISP